MKKNCENPSHMQPYSSPNRPKREPKPNYMPFGGAVVRQRFAKAKRFLAPGYLDSKKVWPFYVQKNE